jgi:hypothetical protein
MWFYFKLHHNWEEYNQQDIRPFVALQKVHPMTQKLLNLAIELGKHWKVFGDRYVCSDGRFYPNDMILVHQTVMFFPLQCNLSIMILQQGQHNPFLSLIEQCHYQSTKMQIFKNCVELSSFGKRGSFNASFSFTLFWCCSLFLYLWC